MIVPVFSPGTALAAVATSAAGRKGRPAAALVAAEVDTFAAAAVPPSVGRIPSAAAAWARRPAVEATPSVNDPSVGAPARERLVQAAVLPPATRNTCLSDRLSPP